jgi:hypothetical protein
MDMTESGSMERKELILIASRTLALLLLAWALVDATYLLEHLFSFVHYRIQDSGAWGHTYLSRYYLVVTILNALRTLALLAAAEWLWKCGAKVEALFSRKTASQDAAEGS